MKAASAYHGGIMAHAAAKHIMKEKRQASAASAVGSISGSVTAHRVAVMAA